MRKLFHLALNAAPYLARETVLKLSVLMILLGMGTACQSLNAEKEYGVAARYGPSEEGGLYYRGATGQVYMQENPFGESENVDWGAELSGYHIDGATDDVEISLIPKLRYHPFEDPGFFVKGGVGPAWNELRGKTNENLGTHFFFASELGAGYECSVSDHSDLYSGVMARHISNAGLDESNGGLNAFLFEVGLKW